MPNHLSPVSRPYLRWGLAGQHQKLAWCRKNRCRKIGVVKKPRESIPCANTPACHSIRPSNRPKTRIPIMKGLSGVTEGGPQLVPWLVDSEGNKDWKGRSASSGASKSCCRRLLSSSAIHYQTLLSVRHQKGNDGPSLLLFLGLRYLLRQRNKGYPPVALRIRV